MADTHIHAVLQASRGEAGRFAQVVETAIRRRMRAEVPFDHARFRAIRDVWHLENAMRYVAQQDARHGLVDPFCDGTIIPDVLGLRVLDAGVAERARQALTRVGREEWMRWGGLDEWKSAPMLVEALPDAMAAAVGRVHMPPFVRECAQARVAACHLARSAGVLISRISTMLRMSRRSVYLALLQAPDATMLRAVEGQLRLRGRSGVGAAPFKSTR